MKRGVILIFLLLSTLSYAQVSDSSLAKLGADIKKGREQLDSINKRSDSMFKVREQKQMDEDMKRNEQNLNSFLAERRAKEKKEAMKNIALGVMFAAILVVGLLRRKKKNNN